MVPIAWGWLFLDHPEAQAQQAWRFWAQITGSTLAPTRGPRDEFSTLLPAAGAPWVELQAIGEPTPRVHLDLDTPDPVAAAAATIEAGGRLVEVTHGVVQVMASPGGFTFCLTPDHGEQGGDATDSWKLAIDRPSSGTYAAQVCLDVPPDLFEAELAFWSTLTGWPITTGETDGFWGLRTPDRFPFWILFQRLGADDPRTSVTAHPDLVTYRDLADERAAHVRLGAIHVSRQAFWDVMVDPAGQMYCLGAPPPPS